MGRGEAWIFAVKRTFICQAKENREKKRCKSRRWFGRKQKRRVIELEDSRKPVMVVPASAANSPVEEVKLMETANEQTIHVYSVALATAMAAEAAVAAAHAAAELVRLRGAGAAAAAAADACNCPGKTKQEIAAIKIQTAFRGYLARRALRALRGLVRLKSLICRQSVKCQVATTLKFMETMARVQSEIRARRIIMTEENSQHLIQQKREKELENVRESMGENRDDSTQSKEKIEANILKRKEAAVKRERALAYAYSHQQKWKNSSNSANQTMGWSWLERWMAARPWENISAVDNKLNTSDLVSTISSHSTTVPTDSMVQSPTARKRSRPSTSNSRVAGNKLKPPSPRRGSVGPDDDSKSINSTQSDRCRRHRIAGSSVRDDESLTSSPAAVRGYMAPTQSARSKSRVQSPLGLEKVGTPERVSSVSSAKKRLSFSSSPAGPRRHSGMCKNGIYPNDDTAAKS